LLALSLSAGAFVLSRSSIRNKLKSMLMGASCCQSKEMKERERECKDFKWKFEASMADS